MLRYDLHRALMTVTKNIKTLFAKKGITLPSGSVNSAFRYPRSSPD